MSKVAPTSNNAPVSLPDPVEMYRRLRDRGNESIQGAQGLLAWNLANMILVMILLITPLNTGVMVNALRFVMLNAMLCVVFGWWRLKSNIRLTWPVVFIFLLQIWLTICSYLAHIQLGRTNDFEASNYFLVMAAIYFFMGSVYVQHWPKLRQNAMNLLLGVVTLSSIVAIGQFLKIGPAMQIAAFYNTFQSIDSWGGAGGVRVVGLAAWPEWMAFQGLIGWAILASRLLTRSLKPWEFVGAGSFLFISFMAQSRIMYVSVILATLIFLFLLVRNDRSQGAKYIVTFVVALLSLFIFAQEKLAYVLATDLQKDPTLSYRQEISWPQAYHIMEERPWVGVGPDNDFSWEVAYAVPDRYFQGQFLDNGYLLLFIWGGIPALTLYLPILFTTIASSFKMLKTVKFDPVRRQLAFLLCVISFGLWNNMFLNNGFTHIYLNCVVAYIGGLLMPTSAELRKEENEKYGMRRMKGMPQA